MERQREAARGQAGPCRKKRQDRRDRLSRAAGASIEGLGPVRAGLEEGGQAVHTTPQTRSRLTPTLAVIICILLVMLTASGCQTPSMTRQVAQRPPMQEAADVGTPAPAPAQADASATAPVAAEHAPVKQDAKPRATVVRWTTAEPGYAPPAAPTEPTEPVAFTTAPAVTPPPASAPPPAPAAALTQALEADMDVPQHAEPEANRPTLVNTPSQTVATPASGEASDLPLFYVFGEVEHPGPYHHTGRNRVFDVIAQVKPTRRANPAKVQLVRPEAGKRDAQGAAVFTINIDQMIRAGDMSQNYRLEPGDILYIPPTGGAKLGLALGSLFGTSTDKDEPQNGE